MFYYESCGTFFLNGRAKRDYRVQPDNDRLAPTAMTHTHEKTSIMNYAFLILNCKGSKVVQNQLGVVFKVHVVKDYPFSAPDKAFFLKYVQDFFGGNPSFAQGGQHPAVGVLFLGPAPVNLLSVQAFGLYVHGYSQTVE